METKDLVSRPGSCCFLPRRLGRVSTLGGVIEVNYQLSSYGEMTRLVVQQNGFCCG